VYVDCSGNSGLAFSGSGDVFAGVLAGLCSRGTDPLTATLWATAIHGRAGERCAERIGPVGYVARDLLTELPGLLVECAN
jgi:NAD(P)H-hydrate repair Nnr-like enzyme with NAD(P)H-hydrate dehydratase domain